MSASKIYNKLVRDRIPDIIRAEGRDCQIETLNPTEYQHALMAKLVEEAQEIQSADSGDLIREIADLYEVIDALLAARAISREIVLEEQARRRAERGGFDKRIRLISTD